MSDLYRWATKYQGSMVRLGTVSGFGSGPLELLEVCREGLRVRMDNGTEAFYFYTGLTFINPQEGARQ